MKNTNETIQTGYKIKQLEWEGLNGTGGQYNYTIAPPDHTKGWRVWVKFIDKYASIGGKIVTLSAADESEAKAIAQADFERRMLQGLELVNDDTPINESTLSLEEMRLENLKQMAEYSGEIVSFDVKDPYYLASCDTCGWVGSSELCIQDSWVNDSDLYCPRCHTSGADCGKVAELYKTKSDNTLTAPEAVYGLLGWLTSREETVVLGARYDSSIGAKLAKEFCSTNNLGMCRESFPNYLKHPSTKVSQSADTLGLRKQVLKEALQAIANIPTPDSLQTLGGHEDAYRAVEALLAKEK